MYGGQRSASRRGAPPATVAYERVPSSLVFGRVRTPPTSPRHCRDGNHLPARSRTRRADESRCPDKTLQVPGCPGQLQGRSAWAHSLTRRTRSVAVVAEAGRPPPRLMESHPSREAIVARILRSVGFFPVTRRTPVAQRRRANERRELDGVGLSHPRVTMGLAFPAASPG